MQDRRNRDADVENGLVDTGREAEGGKIEAAAMAMHYHVQARES